MIYLQSVKFEDRHKPVDQKTEDEILKKSSHWYFRWQHGIPRGLLETEHMKDKDFLKNKSLLTVKYMRTL